MPVQQKIYSAKEDQDVRFADGQFTGFLEVDGALSVAGSLTVTGAINSVGGTPQQEITGDGAIVLTNRSVFLSKATPAAVTIPAPTADGIIISVVSTTNQAHVITGLFLASNNTATFGTAIGNNVNLISRDGRWWSLGATNVTFSTV